MKELVLANTDKVALVDDEDFVRVKDSKWYLTGNASGSIVKYKRFMEIKLCYALASVIMNTKLMYDHIDRNPLNNCKSNLRVCSYSQNSMNRRKIEGTTSKYRGVGLKKNGRWYASIKLEGVKKHIGYFDTENAAALAYNIEATKLFGSFALLNEIN